MIKDREKTRPRSCLIYLMELGGVCVYVGCHVDYQFGEQTDGLDCV
jgi:hypothetical protein